MKPFPCGSVIPAKPRPVPVAICEDSLQGWTCCRGYAHWYSDIGKPCASALFLRGHMVGSQLRARAVERRRSAYLMAMAPYLVDALEEFNATGERTKKFLQKRGLIPPTPNRRLTP